MKSLIRIKRMWRSSPKRRGKDRSKSWRKIQRHPKSRSKRPMIRNSKRKTRRKAERKILKMQNRNKKMRKRTAKSQRKRMWSRRRILPVRKTQSLLPSHRKGNSKRRERKMQKNHTWARKLKSKKFLISTSKRGRTRPSKTEAHRKVIPPWLSLDKQNRLTWIKNGKDKRRWLSYQINRPTVSLRAIPQDYL